MQPAAHFRLKVAYVVVLFTLCLWIHAILLLAWLLRLKWRKQQSELE
jgi:uncharacterized membrane protein